MSSAAVLTSPSSTLESSFRLAVLNPGGRDGYIDYAAGPGVCQRGVHPPVNFHAYAAATRGAFFQNTKSLVQSKRFDTVLVLIRRRVWISLDAVQQLKQAGKRVLVAWKECGPYQVTEQLDSSRALAAYQDLLELADGVLSPTLVPPPRWGWISAEDFARKTRFIPTPYPVSFKDWDYSIPTSEREGILVGTRQFFAPTRNHLRALSECASLSAALGVPVTVINGDRSRGGRILRQLADSFPESRLRIIDHQLPYDAYLKLMASHRVVFQLDRGSVPGQVAGDAVLCRILCAGGNSTLENVVFPDLADDGSGAMGELAERLSRLFQDDDLYEQTVAESQRLAEQTISYPVVARELEEFVKEVA